MPCRKSIFFLPFLRGSSQVSLPFWFCVDGIRNPTQLFLFRFPHSHRSLNQTISPPTSSYSFAQATAMIISALLCLNKSSLFAKTLHPATDAQWFHLFLDIPYSVRLELILSLLSTILSPPFVLASS